VRQAVTQGLGGWWGQAAAVCIVCVWHQVCVKCVWGGWGGRGGGGRDKVATNAAARRWRLPLLLLVQLLLPQP
jgi:hypothetical protein